MNTVARYALVVIALLITLHYTLSFTHEGYGRATSFQNIQSHLRPNPQGDRVVGKTDHFIPDSYYIPNYNQSLHEGVPKANATFVMLARNSDVEGAINAIKDMEMKFNQKWGYPWVFLNEVPFDDQFKKRVQAIIKSPVEFGLIPREHWYQPDWIDEAKAKEERDKMVAENVIYGGSVSYRNMCRFNSGFFYRHQLLQKYRWYWRVEPDVSFSCQIDFDPFMFMQENNKTYGFTIAIYEYQRTIETLWGHIKDFVKLHPEYVAPGNAMGFLSNDNGENYNLCHFWSNFEIADMDFWRGEAYSAYFDYLDSKGGFYYERWGDAPMHSIGAALFLPSHKIHFFNEIGYQHPPYNHCPQGKAWVKGQCMCGPNHSFDYDGYSCLKYWDKLVGPPQDPPQA